jgi:hypothetical protein
VQHALIGVDAAAEERRLDVEVLEDAVQWRIPEAADAILVDLDVFRKLLEFVDDGSRPTVLLQQMRAIAGQRAADAVAAAIENIQRGRRQVFPIRDRTRLRASMASRPRSLCHFSFGGLKTSGSRQGFWLSSPRH